MHDFVDLPQEDSRIFDIVKKPDCQTDIEVVRFAPVSEISNLKSASIRYSSCLGCPLGHFDHCGGKIETHHLGASTGKFHSIAPGTTADIQYLAAFNFSA